MLTLLPPRPALLLLLLALPPPRYYFSHYCKIFRSGAFGLANASIPMLNMLDDHDLIDGFGACAVAD